MGMLTSYAQHTKKHKVQQKTAVTQPVQAKPSGVKEQRQASAKGAHQSVKTQPSPMKGQQVPAKELSATFELNDFSDASDWEAFTQPSDKYTKVSVEEILGKLMNF